MLVTKLSENLDKLEWLHRNCFPSDVMPDWGVGTWWITWEDDKPIAFVGVEPVKSWPGAVYLNRVGVVASHRGKGLQNFLMSKIEKAARESGYQTVISSTYENPSSANNFIRRRYKTYLPAGRWGAPGTVYWFKNLDGNSMLRDLIGI